MKLYFSPGACSLAAHIVIEEAGIPYTLERVDLASHKTEHGEDYTKINPKGYVPALALDNGELLSEVAVVLQYISDQRKDRHLMAEAGSLQRYRQMEWLSFISTELHKQFSPLFRPDTPDAVKQQQLKLLGRRFDYVSETLRRHPYLAGAEFTAPDAYLFTVLNWPDYVKVDMTAWPGLGEYRARIASRPAVQRALKSEGLLK
ncbi:glutathione transferase GstA [Acidiferrobacter sp.]|uniref:glutathione transferase GstA n=1 Tax=Acidiferrobacter sp. TaxID=1872107 RepID=UPI00261DAB6F|nr:glutathione transferase GstA [Acidiferrobacter sp.]